ncbi:MAG: hypothetical protein GY953_55660 [bacterium]|nr:hypothetical protein [bacterium]
MTDQKHPKQSRDQRKRILQEMETQEAKTRASHATEPDSEADADDWSNAEQFCL